MPNVLCITVRLNLIAAQDVQALLELMHEESDAALRPAKPE